MRSAAVLAAVFLVAASASAAESPAQLLSSALAVARAQRSVHYVTTQTSSGLAVSIVGDAAVDRGIQRIRYRKGPRVGHVTVLVAANVAYIRGDAFTLTNYMRIPVGTAAAYAGRWLSLTHTAPDFKPVAAAVRLRSTLDELKMPQPLRSIGPTTVRGRRVVGIQSRFSRAGHGVIETLYVSASGSPLPIEQLAHAGAIQLKAVFSAWNEPVDVSAPLGAVPIQ